MGYNSKFTGAQVEERLDLAYTALQEHQDISGKQDVIEDLADIRNGAKLGQSSLQDTDLEGYATEQWVQNRNYIDNKELTQAISSKSDIKYVDGKIQMVTADVEWYHQNTASEIKKVQQSTDDANSAAQLAVSNSEKAIKTANIAQNAIANLEGLSNADLSAITSAQIVTQVEQNRVNIEAIIDSEIVLSKSAYKELEKNGEIDITKKYYIYDDKK